MHIRAQSWCQNHARLPSALIVLTESIRITSCIIIQVATLAVCDKSEPNVTHDKQMIQSYYFTVIVRVVLSQMTIQCVMHSTCCLAVCICPQLTSTSIAPRQQQPPDSFKYDNIFIDDGLLGYLEWSTFRQRIMKFRKLLFIDIGKSEDKGGEHGEITAKKYFAGRTKDRHGYCALWRSRKRL